MSTWIDTRRYSPIFRIGMRSIRVRARSGLARDPRDAEAQARERDPERAGQRRLGDHVAESDAQVDDRLGDLRANTADDAVRAHQPRGGDRLQEMLGDQ